MPLEAPFIVAISDYGHFDVRFVRPVLTHDLDHPNESGPEVRRYLPPAYAPTIELTEFRLDQYLQIHFKPLGVTLEHPAARHLLSNLRRRVDLWLRAICVPGRELFRDHPDPLPSILGFAYEEPAINGGWCLRRPVSDFHSNDEPFVPAGLPSQPRHSQPLDLHWAVSAAPLPGSEVSPGRWHVWRSRLVLTGIDPSHGRNMPTLPGP